MSTRMGPCDLLDPWNQLLPPMPMYAPGLSNFDVDPFSLLSGAPALASEPVDATTTSSPPKATAPSGKQPAGSSRTKGKPCRKRKQATGNDGSPSDDNNSNNNNNNNNGGGGGGKRKAKNAIRTRTGCWPCRSRHVKCDEARPVCARCQLSGLPCGYERRCKIVAPDKVQAQYNELPKHEEAWRLNEQGARFSGIQDITRQVWKDEKPEEGLELYHRLYRTGTPDNFAEVCHRLRRRIPGDQSGPEASARHPMAETTPAMPQLTGQGVLPPNQGNSGHLWYNQRPMVETTPAMPQFTGQGVVPPSQVNSGNMGYNQHPMVETTPAMPQFTGQGLPVRLNQVNAGHMGYNQRPMVETTPSVPQFTGHGLVPPNQVDSDFGFTLSGTNDNLPPTNQFDAALAAGEQNDLNFDFGARWDEFDPSNDLLAALSNELESAPGSQYGNFPYFPTDQQTLPAFDFCDTLSNDAEQQIDPTLLPAMEDIFGGDIPGVNQSSLEMLMNDPRGQQK